MKFIEHKKVIFFHVLLNIVFALFVTCASYYHIPLKGGKDVLVYILHLCLIQSTFAGILYVFSLSRILFKVVFSVLFLVFGFISFWVYSIDLSMSSALIHAVFTTKSYIVKDLFSLQLLLFLIALVGVLFFLFRVYNKLAVTTGVKLFFPISLLLIGMFFYLDNVRLRSFSTKLPYSLFYSVVSYLEEKEDVWLQKVEKVSSNSNDIKVVLVVGESLRADHLQLNGYSRETTPKLAKRKNVVSFTNVFTNKPNTALSVPCILTNKSIYESSADSIISLFSMMNSRDIPTGWIGNQLLESSYKQIVDTNDNVLIIDELKSFWSFSKKKDFSLIPELKREISHSKRGLFSVHMIGSHWWYEDKYTEEYRKYKPVVDSKYIPSLSKDQMINSYDNTILYLDSFLDEIITILESENQPTMVIYISDHGEALGEEGRWLHSHYESLTNPGMIVWFSDSFKEKYKEKVQTVLERSNESVTTDVIYHSVLDVFGIEKYDIHQSIFDCKK